MVPFRAAVIDRPAWTSAPETWGADGKCSHASDIWMLGIALWELLGVSSIEDGKMKIKEPFAHLKQPTQIEEVMRGGDGGPRPVPLDWTDAAEPPEFRKLVEECCSWEHNQRPTIDEVIDRLVSFGKCFWVDSCFFFQIMTKKKSSTPNL